MCPTHTDERAIATCLRCGTFRCTRCGAPGKPWCDGCIQRGGVSEFKPCPGCGGLDAKKMSFTWWGGALGPSLFTHVKCPGCGVEYNGKTGGSNKRAITTYLVVTSAIGVAGMILYFSI